MVRASWGRLTDIPNAGYFDNAGNSTDCDRATNTTSTATASSRPIRSTPATHDAGGERRPSIRTSTRATCRSGSSATGRNCRVESAFDASYVDRTYKDRPGSVEINQIYEFDPAVGHVVWRGLVDPTQNSVTLSTNNSWNWFVYHGLEFTVTKQAQGREPARHLHPRVGLSSTGGGSRTIRRRSCSRTRSRTRVASARSAAAARTASAPTRATARGRSISSASARAGGHRGRLNLSTLLTLQSGIPSGPIVTTHRRAGSVLRAGDDDHQRPQRDQPALDDDALRV